ncbi:MerR family transcriptional regulator [Erwinia sp. S59]|uniref:MerR family transcriptional regulator n=1 Tax=Erwinia sp. S59 TaxID=2769340 RepID=UPI00190D54F5|nr:MerR family transcriptional regulator [Erwinia sp. S59]MBK0093316.1 MerR family transcriptional regulator [Erwinia sp. S59]
MQLAIGEVAKQSGVSVRAIRHYDRHGLLTSKRACNGYRYFPPQAVTQVRQIQRLINIGFSIAEICSFPDCMLMVEGAAFCPETQALQYKRLEDIERQISELESRRVRLMATLAEGIAK